MNFNLKKTNFGQISMEYLMIIGFLTFVLIGVLGVAVYNSERIRDMIISRQVSNMGDKIVSSAEYVFYSGQPSKVTITVNIPDGVSLIEVLDNTLFVTFQVSSGINKVSFPSNVPLSGSIDSVSGLRRVKLGATLNEVVISS